MHSWKKAYNVYNSLITSFISKKKFSQGLCASCVSLSFSSGKGKALVYIREKITSELDCNEDVTLNDVRHKTSSGQAA